MANWLMELTKLAKTDTTALELLRQLKSATTEEDKEKAKQNGKTYIETHTKEETVQTSNPETTTDAKEEMVSETVVEHQTDDSGDIVAPVHVVQKKEVEAKYDMSEPAFNPRLAHMGITREEELFMQRVYVRKLTRDEKMEIRRNIYQKRKAQRNKVQQQFKEERERKQAALMADPEYQKYLIQNRYVVRIVEALKAHCNVDWMLKNIDGLTVDVIRELLKTPANVNKFTAEKDTFVDNFYKKFGK